MRSRLRDLRLGDVVSRAADGTPGSVTTSFNFSGEFPYPSIYLAHSGCLATFMHDSAQFNAVVDDDFWFVVGDEETHPHARAAIDEFPSRCPRCGGKAYVGLLEVEHVDPFAGTRCPARRK